MKNAQPAKNRNKSWLLAGLLVLAVLPRAALASWGFTASLTFRGSNCGSAAGLAPVLPVITGFPDDASCETTRNQVLAITASGGGCTVGYSCTPCTGTNSGGIGGLNFGGGGISAGQSTLTGGSFATSVFSPLNNGATAVNPFGADAGQPSFSPHYSENSQIWQSEAGYRYQSFPGFGNQAVSITSVQYQNRFAQNLAEFCGDPGCLSHGGGLNSSVIRTMGPTYSQPDAPSMMSDDPSITGNLLPMISIDPSQARSLGGPGVTLQAAPDKQPAPNPEKPTQSNQCRKAWWFNSATKMCYGNIDSCQGDDSSGPHRCYQQ
jgi:hypothetical protein